MVALFNRKVEEVSETSEAIEVADDSDVDEAVPMPEEPKKDEDEASAPTTASTLPEDPFLVEHSEAAPLAAVQPHWAVVTIFQLVYSLLNAGMGLFVLPLEAERLPG